MSKRDIMVKAHAIARTLIGDYAARMSAGLREAWRIYHAARALTMEIRQLIVNGQLGILGVWLVEQGRATVDQMLSVSDDEADRYNDEYESVYMDVLSDYYHLVTGEK